MSPKSLITKQSNPCSTTKQVASNSSLLIRKRIPQIIVGCQRLQHVVEDIHDLLVTIRTCHRADASFERIVLRSRVRCQAFRWSRQNISVTTSIGWKIITRTSIMTTWLYLTPIVLHRVISIELYRTTLTLMKWSAGRDVPTVRYVRDCRDVACS